MPRMLCAAALVVLVAAPACARQVLVWDPPTDRATLAANPTAVAALLAEGGRQASTITTEELVAPGSLTPERVALLVVPTRGVYPTEGIQPLQDYLTAGGAVLTLGGLPFSRTLARAQGRWEIAEVPTDPPGAVQVIADFEAGVPAGLSRNSGDGDEIAWEIEAEDDDGALRASVEDLTSWQYVVFPVPPSDDASLTVLRFRARADERTPLLGIEANETDGSRWKYVVPLSTQWREYRIFIPHFLSYATEDRGGAGDFLHTERLARLAFGFPRRMVGGGPHTLWLDDIERWQFTPPAADAVPREHSAIARAERAYGSNQLRLPSEQTAPMRALFAQARRFEDATLTTTGAGGMLDAGSALPGEWAGWSPQVPWTDGPAYKSVAMAGQRTARIVPVLEASAGGEGIGPAALVVLTHGGDLPRANIGCLCVDADDVLAEPMLREAVVAMADYLTRRPRIVSLEPTFALVDGHAAVTVTARVTAPDEGRVRFRVERLDGSTVLDEERATEAGADGFATAQVSVDAADLEVTGWRASVETVSADGSVDREEFVVDVRAKMIELCDWFVAMQAADGGISGIGFVDQRAVRGLLGMYELTGDERYRRAAIAWGEHELAIQREDGGYRMGYGITPRGEACYVADGGEIAIGMARLVKYVPAERRRAYLDSLRAYYDYRESFRLPDGTIAVGWVFDERYSKVGGDRRREEPFRSDRSFSFVCTCTLAGAAAWQRMTGDPEDRAMAIHDARWYLSEEVNAASVSGEAAQWAHYFIDDPEVRAGFERRMRETTTAWVGRNPRWWIASGGRAAISLSVLNYFYTQIEPDPVALVHLMDGVYHMVSPHSPSGLDRVMAQPEADADEWRYACYCAAALAEVLQPLVTMRGIGE